MNNDEIGISYVYDATPSDTGTHNLIGIKGSSLKYYTDLEGNISHLPDKSILRPIYKQDLIRVLVEDANYVFIHGRYNTIRDDYGCKVEYFYPANSKAPDTGASKYTTERLRKAIREYNVNKKNEVGEVNKIAKAYYILDTNMKFLGLADRAPSETYLTLSGNTFETPADYAYQEVDDRELIPLAVDIADDVLALVLDRESSTKDVHIYKPKMVSPGSNEDALTTATLVKAYELVSASRKLSQDVEYVKLTELNRELKAGETIFAIKGYNVSEDLKLEPQYIAIGTVVKIDGKLAIEPRENKPTFKIPSYCQLYGVKEDVVKELTSK